MDDYTPQLMPHWLLRTDWSNSGFDTFTATASFQTFSACCAAVGAWIGLVPKDDAACFIIIASTQNYYNSCYTSSLGTDFTFKSIAVANWLTGNCRIEQDWRLGTNPSTLELAVIATPRFLENFRSISRLAEWSQFGAKSDWPSALLPGADATQ